MSWEQLHLEELLLSYHGIEDISVFWIKIASKWEKEVLQLQLLGIFRSVHSPSRGAKVLANFPRFPCTPTGEFYP